MINHDKSWCELFQAVVDFLARSRDLKGWILMEYCGIYKQQDIARWYGDTMRYLRGFAAKWNERPTMTMADYAWAWLIGKISKIGTWFSEAWDWRCGVLGGIWTHSLSVRLENLNHPKMMFYPYLGCWLKWPVLPTGETAASKII